MRKSLDGYTPSPLYAELARTPELSPAETASKKTILGYGTGRCGMNWFHRILTAHSNARGGCERFSDFEVFYRYFAYHNLPVDMSGFHALLRRLRNYDWSHADISVIYSPYFDFDMAGLAAALDPSAIIFHIRKPEDAINSMWVKGWYAGDFTCADTTKVPGPQPLQLPSYHHNFGRIMPSGPYFREWSRLTRIGRISWFYVEANTHMLAQHATFNDKAWTVRLADVDQNYEYYLHMAQTLGFAPLLTEDTFLKLKGTTTNAAKTRRSTSDWSAAELADFESIVGPFYDTYDNLSTTGL